MRAKHKIIVLSGKGGVGKSTVSANIAVGLANKGYKVGLLDCDLHGPSIPKLLGIEDKKVFAVSNKIQPFEKNNLKVLSLGLLLESKDTPVVWRGPLKMKAIKQLMEQTEWGELDYFIVDLPPGTGDEPLSIVQLIDDIDGAIIVTTPQDVALLSVRKSINFVREMNVPIIGIIENMSGFRCPHCKKISYIFKEGGGEKIAKEMGLKLIGKIPIDIRIVDEGDDGKLFEEHSSSIQIFKEIVDNIESILEG
ncbi:MAG TPA: ATP-binding protein [Thermoplasmatales archaeon]|nr:ATP-binding protein [Thermoplasmatales archaeon]